jgi:acyl-coenzyme A synthetase/AMP-(fatty) acid ligase
LRTFEPQKYVYHFKHMTTVGEPIEPDVWRWYYSASGNETRTGDADDRAMAAIRPAKH